MDSKSCAHKLNDIFINRFKPVLEIKLFELNNKMLDLDVHHYMTVTKGGFVISEIHL